MCAHLFASSLNEFARAIELDPLYVRHVMLGTHGISAKFLAQVISHTNVRSDWLLWGDGPMLHAENPGVLSVPAKFSSSFPVFNTLESNFPAQQIMPTVESNTTCKLTAAHVQAAELIHAARSTNGPVILFVSAPAIYSGAGIIAAELLRKKYVTAAATTGSGLLADIEMAQPETAPDLNYVARLAAAQGIGYGEAVGRWGFTSRDKKERSIFYTAHNLGISATAHVELGELRVHLNPAGRGSELGAAIGAATYADLLIFAKHVEQLVAASGGVLLLIGDTGRGLNMFLQARAATEKKETTFNVVLIDSYIPLEIENYIQQQHGNSCKIIGAYRANTTNLLNACNAVFSGNDPYDNKTTNIDDC